MTTSKPQASPDKTLADATAWHIRMNSGDADERAWTEFTAWLEADDVNRAAFSRVEDLYADLDSITEYSPEILDASAATNVVALAPPRPAAWRSPAVLGAGLALLAATLVFFVAVRPLTPDSGQAKMTEYATQIGKSRTVTLADGSAIDLNTNTKIAVGFGGAVRQVRLEQGEALFHVAKDPVHPFVVAAGDMDIRDVGTVFNILRASGSVIVTVAEGKVAVSPRGANALQTGKTSQLVAGDQLIHREGSGTVSIQRADPATVLGWRDGYLSYENAPLSQVVSDLNRYFPGVITVQGEAASRKFSGVLRVDDETTVLDRLAKFLSIEVDRNGNGNVTLRIKPGSN